MAFGDLGQWEWTRRYAQRLIEVAGLTQEQAAACARAVPYKELREGYENDPEGAADVELCPKCGRTAAEHREDAEFAVSSDNETVPTQEQP